MMGSYIDPRLRRTSDVEDPLSRALAPPPGASGVVGYVSISSSVDETPEELDVRIRRERVAAKVSDDIDRELRREEQAARRQKCLKILLLGQSESGKSTVLKNFQRKYDPSAFDRERAVWRSVCQLNVVRSFGIILDVLNHVFDEQDRNQHGPLTPPVSPISDLKEPALPASTRMLTASHRRLMMRLAPLRQIEHALMRRFKADLPWKHPGRTAPPSPAQELYVSGYAWQRVRAEKHMGTRDSDEDEELGRVLSACQEDMVALWNDAIVRAILRERRVELEQLSGFFLDDLARIAVLHYAPTDDDVLRARLKTIGVTEHNFAIRATGYSAGIMETEGLNAAEFRIYDVGGSRATWMPFFDDVNTIVFLAPMSAFDQTLVEAPEINRLEDTFGLWKNICQSKLLVTVSLVLLLNKRDVLERKLEAGVRFGRYVKSYRGENRWQPIAKYLKTKFKAVQRELSPTPRMFYAHITCATDTKQMTVILAAIEDLVLRQNLKQVNLL